MNYPESFPHSASDPANGEVVDTPNIIEREAFGVPKSENVASQLCLFHHIDNYFVFRTGMNVLNASLYLLFHDSFSYC